MNIKNVATNAVYRDKLKKKLEDEKKKKFINQYIIIDPTDKIKSVGDGL